MKTPRLLVLLLAAFFATLAPRPAEANVEVSFDFFYDSLSPHGEWIEVADYGTAWRPTDVDRDWAPYADGYWAFTDAGWTWVSYEEFGGIVYHYGRWIFANGEGWCWVPGHEWGPGWVSWRQNDDYVGWAPLPPEARWEPTVGLSVWVDRQYDIGPGYYNFCRSRDFGAPVLRPVIINRSQNVTIIRQTVNITNITYNNYENSRVIYNGGLNYDSINRRSDRRVPALKLVQDSESRLPGSRDWDRERDGRDRDGRGRNFNARAEGNQLVVTAPTVRRGSDQETAKPTATRVIGEDRVTRGWNGVKNAEVRDELRAEIQRQTRGLTPQTAPARAVAAAELEAIPVKADPKAVSPVATRDRSEPGDRRERGAPATTPPEATPATPTQEGRTAERPMREGERGEAPRGTERPVAGQSGLKPFNPATATDPARRSGSVPAATPATSERSRGDQTRSERSAEGTAKSEPTGSRKGAMSGPATEAAAQRQNEQAKQEKAGRQQAEAVAEQKRGAEMQREAAAQRANQQQADRQMKQAEQNQAARQQAEANARKQQMEGQRAAESQRQRQSEAAVAGERQRQQQQMDAQRQAVQESARQQGADRARQPAVEQQQRRQPMEQPRGGQERQRQPAEQPAEAQSRGREQKNQPPQQSRGSQEGQRGPSQPSGNSGRGAAATPAPSDNERGRGGGR